MRSVVISILLAAALSGCATVSMVASEATVETNLSAEESSLRNVSDAYIDMAERKKWVEKNQGLLDFARVLMEGSSSNSDKDDASYVSQVQAEADNPASRADLIRTDIESATHGLNVATLEAQKLFGADLSARSLRADLVSYESALVTAKKARRTFISALSELDMDDANPTSYALAQFDVSIDTARDAADKLADYAAARKKAEARS